ncbi:MAG: hypothetical protein GF317_13185 [Candidatus Lokiarchaeota archaeon]|nr:hypothetical protein [Candidatus Lokiarchaeota archaeon]MBD3200590.1 hypothetical protein [Candidatus Lokiarchaeota archaeon]
MKDSWPILVSGAQIIHHKSLKTRLDPLKLIIKSCEKAIESIDNEKIKNFIDTVYMININSWSYRDAPGELSKRLRINPSDKVYLSDGGNTPQMLVNRAAKAIYRGEKEAVLICGGEAAYSVYQSKKGSWKLDWNIEEEPEYMEGEIWHGINEFENKYKMIIPPYAYAVFESAVRKSKGVKPEEHREYLGKLFKRFAKVASKNPYAWTRKNYSIGEIISPNAQNRMVSYPYTKRMCANMFVDQSASIIITHERLAEELKIDKKHWVYLMGSADYHNVFEITRRPSLHRSPAAREGAVQALTQAGLKLADIDKFDLYSCFPSIVEIISEEIGLKEIEHRELTITGGLPYFGGPWSNYSLHGIATAIDLIQKNRSTKIMVVANGGYNNKQSFGIYGNNPPSEPWDEFDEKKAQSEILQNQLDKPIKRANGLMEILGYTIIFNRDGTPDKGIVIGKIDKNHHSMAFFEGNKSIFNQIKNIELIGNLYPVYYDSERKCNILKISNENFERKI